MKYVLDANVALKWVLQKATRQRRLESPGPLVPRAVALSSAFRVGVYDCLYIVLAESEGSELLTADTKLVNSLGARFPFILPPASVP